MRISGRKTVGGAAPVGGTARPASQDKAEKLQAPILPKADDVELSASSREVDKAKALLAGMSDVRAEKIEGIKPLVVDGSYRVETRQVAKKIVDSSLRESTSAAKNKK